MINYFTRHILYDKMSEYEFQPALRDGILQPNLGVGRLKGIRRGTLAGKERI